MSEEKGRREGGEEKKLGRVGGQQRRRRGAGQNAGARTTEHVSCHCYPAERLGLGGTRGKQHSTGSQEGEHTVRSTAQHQWPVR